MNPFIYITSSRCIYRLMVSCSEPRVSIRQTFWLILFAAGSTTYSLNLTCIFRYNRIDLPLDIRSRLVSSLNLISVKWRAENFIILAHRDASDFPLKLFTSPTVTAAIPLKVPATKHQFPFFMERRTELHEWPMWPCMWCIIRDRVA